MARGNKETTSLAKLSKNPLKSNEDVFQAINDEVDDFYSQVKSKGDPGATLNHLRQNIRLKMALYKFQKEMLVDN